jgi:hypothetical protein
LNTSEREMTMSKLTIDHALLLKLKGVMNRTELCDESGRIVGVFTPPAANRLYVEPTSEELDEAEKGPLFTTDEVMDYVYRTGSRS